MLRGFTNVDIADFGCAFNAYRRSAIEPVLGSIGKQKFTKALVLSAGASVVEVDLDHRAREDQSRYSPFRLIRLALHVLAGFWPQPIQWAGVLIGTSSCLLVARGGDLGRGHLGGAGATSRARSSSPPSSWAFWASRASSWRWSGSISAASSGTSKAGPFTRSSASSELS